MESSKNNPILNFRLGNKEAITEPVEELDFINDLNRNDNQHHQNSPGGSFITLTRETADNTEFSG